MSSIVYTNELHDTMQPNLSPTTGSQTPSWNEFNLCKDMNCGGITIGYN